MEEHTVSLNRVITLTAWGATTVLIVAAWVIALSAGFHRVAILLAVTACPISGFAAAMQVRGMACGMAQLIRATYAGGKGIRPLT